MNDNEIAQAADSSLPETLAICNVLMLVELLEIMFMLIYLALVRSFATSAVHLFQIKR